MRGLVLLAVDPRVTHPRWWLHEGRVDVWWSAMEMWLPPLIYTPLPQFARALTETEIAELPKPKHTTWDHPAREVPPLKPWWANPSSEIELLGLDPNPKPRTFYWRYE